jgi:hypothetical protein
LWLSESVGKRFLLSCFSIASLENVSLRAWLRETGHEPGFENYFVTERFKAFHQSFSGSKYVVLIEVVRTQVVVSGASLEHVVAGGKYTVAFPRMSRFILPRANSARKRLISICSALTFDRQGTLNGALREVLTQLNNVCSTMSMLRAAARCSGPTRTASCLNSACIAPASPSSSSSPSH